jgi:hypothetical protein
MEGEKLALAFTTCCKRKEINSLLYMYSKYIIFMELIIHAPPTI